MYSQNRPGNNQLVVVLTRVSSVLSSEEAHDGIRCLRCEYLHLNGSIQSKEGDVRQCTQRSIRGRSRLVRTFARASTTNPTTAMSLKTQKPSPHPAKAWCVPPAICAAALCAVPSAQCLNASRSVTRRHACHTRWYCTAEAFKTHWVITTRLGLRGPGSEGQRRGNPSWR